MKKILIAAAAMVFISIGAIYLFIPKELVVSDSAIINASDKIVFDYLKDKKKLARWWPGKEVTDSVYSQHDTAFHYNGQIFTTKDLLYNSLVIDIGQNGFSEESKIVVVVVKTDTAKVAWECRIKTSINPLKRLRQYNHANSTKQNMRLILGSLQSFLNKNENIYGFPIAIEKIKDTLYISHTIVQQNYPDTKLIASALEKLHQYTSLTLTAEAGHPIMTVTNLANGHHHIVFGIPINKPIPETKDFQLKIMPASGRAVTTIVVGGVQKVLEGLDAIHTFQADYWLNQPIVPFFSMVTDRNKEPDSTKWVTKIWAPVY